MHRKEFIKLSGMGIMAASLSPTLVFCNSNRAKQTVQGNRSANPGFAADIDIRLTAMAAEMQILPGEKTRVFTYQSELLKGEDHNLRQIENSFLGPVIKVKQGQKIRIYFDNEISQESIIHWHGLHISHEMDGHPMYVINKGEQYVYEFEVNNRPGTYWFHPHPHGKTGPQVYGGLAGLFIVEGNENNLPSGSYDVPLVIQDRTFDSGNKLIYLQNNRMERMTGFLGDRILINGQPDKSFDVSKSTWRFRVLNGSNSRIYKLAWNDGEDLVVIGTDGGLLPRPVKKPYLMLAPGERAEIWKDFSHFDAGKEVLLRSLSFEGGSIRGMGGGMMGGGMMQSGRSIENGAAIDLCRFIVTDKEGEKKPLPSNFEGISPLNPADAINPDAPRQFRFYNEHMQWVINGETFKMHEVAEWEKVKLNTTEIWEFINGNDGGGMGMMNNMMQIPHPVHIHGLQFHIIERDVSGMDASVWNSVKDGFVNEGWQDTFLLMPGMKVRIVLRFQDFTGKYIYHCHNLEHEDMGMMRNYEVVKV